MMVGVPVAILAAMLVMGATVVAIITGRPVIASRIGQLSSEFVAAEFTPEESFDAHAEAKKVQNTSTKVAKR